jgi:ribose transport system substrate-binding protein
MLIRSTRSLRVRCCVTLCMIPCGLAACGAQTHAGGGVRAAPTQVAAAAGSIERFRAIPAFTAPGPAFDARAHLRGKTIFEIPITSEVPFITAVEGGMRRAAGIVGARLVVYPNQGRPEQWEQGIRTAIAQHAAAITLLAQDPGLLGPGIAEAEKAGIPVVVVRTSGEHETCQADAAGHIYGTACVPGPFEQAGRLEADWVIATTQGQADVLVITSSDARSTTPLVRALKDEFRTRCPGCRLRFTDVPIPRWADELRGEVQSALVRDPGLNYVIPIYDSMSQYVVPAIRANAGAASRVKIATFNGTPFVLQLLRRRESVRMDAGEDLAWVGWAAMDQAFRLASGVPPLQSERTPLRVFDAGDVGEAGSPPGVDRGYGSPFVAGYRRLWGVAR